jgi:hypothetical protein
LDIKTENEVENAKAKIQKKKLRFDSLNSLLLGWELVLSKTINKVTLLI